jgi:hypothetical protein
MLVRETPASLSSVMTDPIGRDDGRCHLMGMIGPLGRQNYNERQARDSPAPNITGIANKYSVPVGKINGYCSIHKIKRNQGWMIGRLRKSSQ